MNRLSRVSKCIVIYFHRFIKLKKSLPPATKLGQGYVFTHVCDSVHRGVVSQHALQVVSQHALQQVLGGGIPACLAGLQAHTQGVGKLRGLAWGVSRPTPGGGGSRPTPGGKVSQHALWQTHPPHTHTATAAGSTPPIGMHSCCQ